MAMIKKYVEKNPPTTYEERQKIGRFFDDESARSEVATVTCECGAGALHVNFIEAPYTGGFLKVTCPNCGKSEVLMDDYA